MPIGRAMTLGCLEINWTSFSECLPTRGLAMLPRQSLVAEFKGPAWLRGVFKVLWVEQLP